jgi:hypothetical protein
MISEIYNIFYNFCHIAHNGVHNASGLLCNIFYDVFYGVRLSSSHSVCNKPLQYQGNFCNSDHDIYSDLQMLQCLEM